MVIHDNEYLMIEKRILYVNQIVRSLNREIRSLFFPSSSEKTVPSSIYRNSIGSIRSNQ